MSKSTIVAFNRTSWKKLKLLFLPHTQYHDQIASRFIYSKQDPDMTSFPYIKFLIWSNIRTHLYAYRKQRDVSACDRSARGAFTQPSSSRGYQVIGEGINLIIEISG